MKHKFKEKIYFKDELLDDVDNFEIERKKIDGNYKYIHTNPFYKFFSFILYFIFAKVVVWFYVKFKRIKYVNRDVLKKEKGGFFIYANHTSQIVDGFHPTFACKRKPHIICNADNVSMPVLGKLTPMWGALPLPDTFDATKNFNRAIEFQLSKKNPIVLYPEAHLWPYYTKIRPFSDKSFRYPVQFDKPCYTFTTTYQQRKYGKKPKVTIYVDGPFYVNKNLDKSAQRQDLRDRIYATMCERSKNSNYEYLDYIKIEENKGENE